MEAGVVLVGGGVGAVSVARRLRGIGYAGPLTLVSDEGVAPYDRPPLSKQYLAGALGDDELGLFRPDELTGLDVTLLTGRVATGLAHGDRELLLEGGGRVPYRVLVVATGARARRLPFGDDLTGVHYLRTLADAERLAGDVGPGRRLVVVGGGFIGLEVAATAHALGAEVTVLETAPQPLTRVLGPSAGALVTALHGERVDLRFGVAVTGLIGDGRVRAVRADGEELPADAVVVGIGAIPNTEWLDGSGLRVDDGVVCDEGGRTTAPGVYAVGDVARWRHGRTGTEQRVEQWQTAVEQASVVAANIAVDLGVAEAAAESWDAVPYFWSDQYEHKIQFCGRPGDLVSDRPVRRGVVACFADAPDGVATGVLAVDNPAALARGRRMVAAGTPWPEMVAWLESL
ncbi:MULTISPECIES: NAD(P)/FAD-dependent oxidoreductase [unclassified Nocardioides]|uniref:NAD(P)/FAD-dependent oxidoreductase n=1 Tax=unclassified Nocardioides TaxID=2615069 RepID=UPI00361F09F0